MRLRWSMNRSTAWGWFHRDSKASTEHTGYIDKHGSIKRADVMDLCRITKDQAYKLLNRLKSSGRIAQIGSRKGAVYERQL
jgi:hypothetical protein